MKGPKAFANLEIGQMVNDVSRCGMTTFAHSVFTEASNVKGKASQYAISAAIYASKRAEGVKQATREERTEQR
jgi:hypothetical protein